MDISLTKEEFEQRMHERWYLLFLAIGQDIKSILPLKLHCHYADPKMANQEVDLVADNIEKELNDLLIKAIAHVINGVYDEALD